MTSSAIIGSPLTASPLSGPLFSVLEETCKRCGDREALVAEDGRLTFTGLQQHVDAAAKSMLGLGLQRGDHVGILLGNSAKWAVLFYAAASLGLVTVPLNTRFRDQELAYALKHEDIKALFTTDNFLGKINFVQILRRIEPAIDQKLPGTKLPELQHLVVVGSSVPAAGMAWNAFASRGGVISAQQLSRVRGGVMPDDLMLIQFTSGSTAQPKGVMLSHSAMLGNAASVCRRMGVKGSDRYYSPRPFSHVAGTTMSLLVSLVGGCTLITAGRFDAAEALRTMEAEGCTLTSGNDTMFLMMLDDPTASKRDLKLRGGWAAAGPEVMHRVMEELGAFEMCNAYGLSEAGPNVVLSDRTDPPELRIEGWAKPHWGMQCVVVDPETGDGCEDGVPGEICVRGWSVMKGYYKLEEETQKALEPNGWLHTGDLGQTDMKGRLQFLGRLKDLFRVGGENVAPLEVESVLLQHPAIALAQVVGVPDERLGEVPAAFVTLRRGHKLDKEELKTFCAERAANFKVPRHVEVVDSFESIGMTESNKIQKTKLRDRAIELFCKEKA
ncbi:MAG: AMP-binding protein [Sneathiellaceae bacterium]